ncbi:ras-domain-containing protein [Sistotremastrum suecicum HHB10207 ss-3]|uniref:Ras-domain-containing protein n=1 Tax=Sistotremastrum suecicum HHB10207 ss-3 TaxID=1314776 RepID=A0A166EMX9_9AGAM|nr:ras-domain-containing protein [Sistotremastrum suecicum HHB10207 ss-3]
MQVRLDGSFDRNIPCSSATTLLAASPSPSSSPRPRLPPPTMAQEPIKRKLVIVGDGACGKTSLLCCFALGEFPKEYHPAIFENYVAEIRLDRKPVQLALWDTAGQEEYERLRPLSYSKSHVILIAFSIDSPDSLDNVTVKWIEEVRSICGPHLPVILVGCKSDLRPPYSSSSPSGSGGAPPLDQTRFVSTERGMRVAQEIGARAYKECSALKIEGVDDVFEAATRASMLVRDGNSGVKPRRSHGHIEESDAGGCCVVC